MGAGKQCGDNGKHFGQQYPVSGKGWRKGGQDGANLLQGRQQRNPVEGSLLDADNCLDGAVEVAVAGRFSAPGGAEHMVGALPWCDEGAVVIQQLRSGKCLHPHAALRAFAGAGFAQKQYGALLMDDAGGMDGEASAGASDQVEGHPEGKMEQLAVRAGGDEAVPLPVVAHAQPFFVAGFHQEQEPLLATAESAKCVFLEIKPMDD